MTVSHRDWPAPSSTRSTSRPPARPRPHRRCPGAPRRARGIAVSRDRPRRAGPAPVPSGTYSRAIRAGLRRIVEQAVAFRRGPALISLRTSRSVPSRAAATAPPSGAAPGRALPARLLRTCLLAIAVALLLAAAFLLDMFAATRARAVDLLLLARPIRSATATVIVGVDERSADRLRPRYGPVAAWPRTLYARVFRGAPRRLAEAGRAGRALRRSPRRRRRAGDGAPARGQRDHPGGRPGGAGLRSSPRRRAGVRAVRPAHPAVRDVRLDEGIVNVTAARDGVVRGHPAGAAGRPGADPELRPGSRGEVHAAREGRRRPLVRAGGLYAAGRAIPVAERDSMLINFLGPPSNPGGGGPFRIIPMVDILDGAFDPQWVQDKIVLVGFTRPRASTSIPRRRRAIAGCGVSRSSATRSRPSCTSASWCPCPAGRGRPDPRPGASRGTLRRAVGARCGWGCSSSPCSSCT